MLIACCEEYAVPAEWDTEKNVVISEDIVVGKSAIKYRALRSSEIKIPYYNTTAAFSYKANTYLAAGLPIVNLMVGDLQRLVVERGIGFNYKGGDVNSLRRCFTQINESTLSSMAQNCEQFFAAELDRTKIREKMLNCLRQYTEPSSV